MFKLSDYLKQGGLPAPVPCIGPECPLWRDPGAARKHPDQSDGEPLGNDDWVGGKIIFLGYKPQLPTI
jgi:hypothetical protein